MFNDSKTMRLFTHEEAIKRQCPMTMASDRSSVCRGMQCMAWRWPEGEAKRMQIRAHNPNATSAAEAGPHPHQMTDLGRQTDLARKCEFEFVPFKRHGDHTSGGHWEETDESVAKTTPGYCGMVSG